MTWLHDLSYLFGGAFLTNAIPHFVSGVMGRPFQSPFANPPGEGLSSSTINVLWGFFNLAVGYVLPLIYLLISLRYGKLAGDNPFRATGLEWKTSSPPPEFNFDKIPVVVNPPYAYDIELREELEAKTSKEQQSV